MRREIEAQSLQGRERERPEYIVDTITCSVTEGLQGAWQPARETWLNSKADHEGSL